MNKKYLVIIILLAATTVIFALISYPYWTREILNPNSISVSVGNHIELEKVRITWGYDSIQGKTLYADKKDFKKHYKDYGENFFNVLYQDSLIARFYQFKFNNWHGHHYSFNLTLNRDSIYCDWNVKGPDSARTMKIYPKTQ
ncbi:hypothetical protein [Carboxylicivirga marina]|uniref:hypothetical protein n=1 Tax=Carboxylicivirga marina TaxID=2800988 RepID=UPI0025983E38|nr:hypothetical protein [uncultured Carboxylicivirga sp.]